MNSFILEKDSEIWHFEAKSLRNALKHFLKKFPTLTDEEIKTLKELNFERFISIDKTKIEEALKSIRSENETFYSISVDDLEAIYIEFKKIDLCCPDEWDYLTIPE